MNPFGPTTQKPLELRKFDSAAEQISTVANKVSSSDREQQSVIEQVRQIALNILSDTVDAISENQLEEDEMGIDYLDGLIIDALGDANDAIYENALMSSLSDAFLTFGVVDTDIEEIFSENIEAADVALEAAVNTMLANMPDDGPELEELIREFIFGEADETEEGFDSIAKKIKARNGAFSQRKVNGRKVHYRGVLAIRQGQKTVVNKRLPGQKVRLTTAQKAGMKKARLHAFSANAIRKRLRSFNKGKRLGIY
ncbi:hypothetical protein IIQ44_03785 [Acinetobacter oleivorans]|uniref:Uncharacterized protein n=1 Tax=Acinetobacter oleivorans (strain JCM 16667 / KCTC 23045 / DR1) TaxID=436717 RepID=A0AAN0P7U0_ACISD|nr:hypothetical protein [Acinetobacter oleivorans]ADI90458.1 hypothetical protein AOLE_07835 [Acinetobacter oleivorans DR1]ESK45216.1 hypothetical protein P254_00827 [Acinetobacter oleivorans CIP 110421]MBE2171024.1 hypothetical protein [Acinetobacter oleivorans]